MQVSYIVLGLLAAYLITMAVLGARSRKYATSFRMSMTGGGTMSAFLVIGMAMGGHIGSGFVVGGSEYGAAYGIGGAWYGVACALSLITSGVFMARFICRNKYVSLADFFRVRYEDRVSLRLLTTVSNVLNLLALFAGQLLAGKAIFYMAGIDGNIGVIVTAAIALTYSALCGMQGAMAAATLQTIAISAGVLVTLAFLVSENGIGQLAGTLPVQYFDPVPFDTEQLVMVTVPTMLATTIGQPNFQRSLAAKSEKIALWGSILGGILLLPVAFIPVLIGMYGRSFYPELSAIAVFAQIAMDKLPLVLGAVLLSIVICAVVTTCNTMLISLSAIVVHDMVEGIFWPEISDRNSRRLNTLVNILVGAFGALLAVSMKQVIELLALGCTFSLTGCLVPLMGGVFWKKSTGQGATAAAALGMGFTLLDFLGIVTLPYASISPLIPSALGYIAVSLLTQPKQNES